MLLVIAWCAVGGARRGLILSVYDLVTSAAVLVLAVVGFAPAGAWLAGQFGWSSLVADVVGFLAIIFVGEVLRWIGAGLIRAATGPIFTIAPMLALANILGGLLAGALRGVAYAGIALLVVEGLPFATALLPDLQSSPVATNVLHVVDVVFPSATGLLHQAFGTLVPTATGAPLPLPAGALAAVGSPSADQTDSPATDRLPFQVPNAPIDPTAEATLVQMTNLARVQVGLSPLQVDPQLTAVARAHSAEMSALGYFAHQSPVAGSPFDRLRAAQIAYDFAAENIAYAPSVAQVYQGLMQSPLHRENLLSPAAHRLGIGVVHPEAWGYLVTEDFAN
jgi:uncharacterized protein YkwD